MTRAVVFDVDGVLVHGFHARPDQRKLWDESLVDLGIDPERFQTEFIFDIFLKKVLIGQTSIIDALDRRLPGLGYKGSTMVFAHHWLNFESTPNAELISAIKLLKNVADVKLYIATNQDHMRAQWLWDRVGLGEVFDDIFYSARARRTKAHRGFFELAESHMGKLKEPPLFFDDTQKVLDVARSQGWGTVLFKDNADFFQHPWIAERLTPSQEIALQ
jgi:putative hydrolase of the HAD superfamily